jgi:hypothetical protein
VNLDAERADARLMIRWESTIAIVRQLPLTDPSIEHSTARGSHRSPEVLFKFSADRRQFFHTASVRFCVIPT